MLLFMLATTIADRQENTESQEAIPQMRVSCYTDAEQSAAARTMAHLFDEYLAIPIYVTGELPGYHSTHSKPKCLQGNQRSVYNNPPTHDGTGLHTQRIPIYHHVIDYYIYTLEHILI